MTSEERAASTHASTHMCTAGWLNGTNPQLLDGSCAQLAEWMEPWRLSYDCYCKSGLIDFTGAN